MSLKGLLKAVRNEVMPANLTDVSWALGITAALTQI